MSSRITRATSIAAAVLLAAPAALAAELAVTHTGYLLEGQDQPVTRVGVSMAFAIWSDLGSPDTNNRKWTSGNCTVDVRDGRYAVTLGAGGSAGGCGTALGSDALPLDGARFLEVTVDGTVLTPRMRLGTAPTAGIAADALALGGRPAKDYALKAELDFTKLLNVPAGLADGDDDTKYAAGSGIAIEGTTISLAGADALPAGIDATKIGGGAVTNAQFAHLAGVTAPIQQQLAGRAAAGPNADITSLTGLTTALTVAQGGTGASALAGSGALVMNAGGTAAVSVAPGTSGNVLTSNGTGWVSAPTGLSTTDRQRIDAMWEHATTRTCQTYQQNNPGAADGVVSLRIAAGRPAVSVYCLFSRGGWMRLATLNDGGGVTESLLDQRIPVTQIRLANTTNFDDGAEADFQHPFFASTGLDKTSTNGWRFMTLGSGGYGLYSGVLGRCNWGNPTIWGAGYNGSCGTDSSMLIGYTGGATAIARRFSMYIWGR